MLSLRGISKNFGAVSALTDIDLDVHAGEVVALVGDNGAGKSTLVKILAGVHQPSSGTITFRGKPVTLADPSAALTLGIATVFQDLALCENLDVVANIFLGQELNPLRLDEVAMEVRAWTLLNELSARIPSVREVVASLSGGQRQTVAIARSLLLEPKLILLDEPTAALGVAQTAEVLNLIERVRDRGLGVLMISHNMEDVRAVADRIVVLRLGRNNGVFAPDASNQELVSAITGASNNAVSRRAERRQARARANAGAAAMTAERQAGHTGGHALLDRSDVRVKHEAGVGGAIRAFLDRVRSGDLGSLPVIVGLVIIWTVFTSLNPIFLSAQQPGQPAVRLLDGRRHRARHRLRADGRRDRPVGRLDQRLRLGAGRRALGQPGLAGGARHPRRGRRRRLHRRALRAAVQPARHAELRLDAGRPARGARPAALHPRLHRLDQPALRLDPGEFRPAAGDAGLASPTRWRRCPASSCWSPACAPSAAAAPPTCRRRRSAA